jgi:hypothetical protein
MVNTVEMLSDEYSHYILRYCAIRSGVAEYDLTYPNADSGRDESLYSVLQSNYETMFDVLMDDLESMDDERRIRFLSYVVYQIDSFDLIYDINKDYDLDDPSLLGHHG